MGEAGLEVYPGFLMGRAGTRPLVGGAVARGVPNGGCVLRKSLGSQSADGWDCVPTMVIVWPKVSQHQSLQAFGWGQVLLMTQARVLLSASSKSSFLDMFTTIYDAREIHHQPPPPQEILQDQQVGQTQAPMNLLLLSASQCVIDFVCPSKNGVSVSPSLVKLLQ